MSVRVPSRVTWTMPLPHGARFMTAVVNAGATRVRFRVGISDERIYEGLWELTLSAADRARPLDIDLSAYAGRKWSLFYHPDRIAWHLTLGADAVDGAPSVALWERPEIMTSREGAAELAKRQKR